MSREDHRRDPSPYRRRSPPSDIRRSAPRAPAAGIQIRGLAKEREERQYRAEHHFRDDRRDPQDRRESYDRREGDTRRDPATRLADRSPPPRRYANRNYRDRDREDYRSPDREFDSKSSSPHRRDRSPHQYHGAPPNRELILEGFPPDISEEDIINQLKNYRIQVETLEDVRIIRDRKTGASRQFGFIRFSSIPQAKTFLEQHHSSFFLYGNNPSDKDNQIKVRIAFSRDKEDRDKHGSDAEWICSKCFGHNYSRRVDCYKCQTPKPDAMPLGGASKPSRFTNTGDSDVSPDGATSQYLLFRGLEPSVTEEILAKGVAKLLKSKEEQLVAGNSKIVSTSTVAHAGARLGSIRRILLVRDRRTDESWRYGFAEFVAVEDAQAAMARFNSFDKFTIASKEVIASHIHAGVFVPVFNPPPGGNQNFTFTAAANPALQLGYWDEEAYVSELLLEHSEPEQPKPDAASSSASTDKPGSKKSAAESKSKKRKPEPANGVSSSTKKPMPSHLQFWTNRHAELHGVDPPSTSAAAPEPPPEPTTKPPTSTSTTSSPPASTPNESFTDPIKHCCYLCSRQFPTPAAAAKHERASALHSTNLVNETLVATARAKLEKASAAKPAADTTATAYRDRAQERRAAFNQPTKPAAEKRASPSPPAAASAEAAAAPPPPIAKGAALLGKMGWSAGAGLGARGTGITAPVEAAVFVAGVGLGAEGGKVGDAVGEAERNTVGGYEGFLERTREGARERFGRLG